MRRSLFIQSLFLLVFILTAVSCHDSEESVNARLFKPSNVKVYSNYNGLTVMWDRSPGATSYEIEVAKNESFEPIVVAETVPPEKFVTSIKNLEEETLYFVRVRGLGKTAETSSHYVQVSVETGLIPSIFENIAYEEMGYDNLTLRWEEPEITEEGAEPFRADRIILTASGSEDRTVELTAENLEKKSVHIEGLNTGVSYKASMMDGDAIVSYVFFDMPERPEGAIEIDNTGSLKNTIENAPDGATVILKAGQVYDHSKDDIAIDRNITIIGAPGGKTPVVHIKKFVLGGKIKSESHINLIRFSHIEISGMPIVGGVEADIATVAPSGWAFGFDVKDYVRKVSIDKFSLENCVIRNFEQAAIRVDWTIKDGSSLRFGEISVNNLLAYDLGRKIDGVQAFIHLNSNDGNKGIHCAKYTIKNSTFYHLATGLIEARKCSDITDEAPTVEISNCTFDKFAIIYPNAKAGTNESSRSLFNFKSYNSATISISNSVFGEAKTDWSILLKPQALESGAVWGTCVNSYICNDTKFTDMSKLQKKELGANEIFPNRGQFDFTIAESAMLIGAGDPRWNK